MKTVLLFAGALFALDASASYSVRPIAYTPPMVKHTWFCEANGYDYNGTRHSVSGGLKPTQADATRDAIRACQALFTVCQVGTCIQEQ
jgi:hypothetical protein